MPRAIRDRVYDFIARRRYRLFGRADQCILPDERIRSRFEGLPDPASGETHP
jgi:predicted DCC family thiol-disulfide oxidoreductase YuxK